MHRINLEERRRKIAQVAAEMIARDGGDAVTVRQIAAQVGSSTTFITKYFADKTELLLSAYKYSSTTAVSRFEQRIAEHPGDLIASLASLTAIDEDTRAGWRVHIAFWDKAVREPVLATELRYWVEHARKSIEAAITTWNGGTGENVKTAAKQAIALIHGISIQLLFDPGSWTREQIHEALARQMETTLGRKLSS
jgi:AcrR family transcriptional regulator